MKNVVFLFLFFSLGVSAQIIGINPNSPTNLDSISFVIRTHNPFWYSGYTPPLVDYKLSVSGNFYKYDFYFDNYFPFGPGGLRFDTVHFDSLMLTGNYSIIGQWHFVDSVQGYLDTTSGYLDTIQFSVLLSTGFKKVELQNTTISPNPVRNLLTIQNSNQTQINQIQIWDLRGRLVKEIKYENEKIDVSDLAGGVYVLRVIGDKGSKELKLLKQ